MVTHRTDLAPAVEGTSVTCLSLPRRVAASTEVLGAVAGDAAQAPQRLGARLADRLRREDGPAQFARFVLVGAVASALYAGLFIALDGLGDQPANVLGSLASSALANELHRRLTFHAGGRVSWWAAQWEAGGIALLGIVATSLALAWLDVVLDASGVGAHLLLVAAVTAAIGVGRFVALRWLFAPRAGRRA